MQALREWGLQMSKWTRGSKRKRRKGNTKGARMGKVVQIGPAEEFDEDPGQAGKRKIVRIETAGERASMQSKEG